MGQPGPTQQRRHNSLRKTRTLAFSICLVLLISFWLPVARMDSQEKPPDYKNPRLPVDRRVADLLSRMTLEEKVAQLTCLWGNRPRSIRKQIFPAIAVISLRPRRPR